MVTDHDSRAWRVATALAHATGLYWAQWAMGPTCRDYGHSPRCDNPDGPCTCGATHRREPHVPAPWDTDAYLADCRRRGVEPGPLPSLMGPGWTVHDHGDGVVCVSIDIDGVEATVANEGSVWIAGACRPIESFVSATNLARVAAEAMR